LVFYGKESFIGRFTVLFLVIDGKEKVCILTIDFHMGFVVVEVKVGLLCNFYGK